jgi:hypothetical protein
MPLPAMVPALHPLEGAPMPDLPHDPPCIDCGARSLRAYWLDPDGRVWCWPCYRRMRAQPVDLAGERQQRTLASRDTPSSMLDGDEAGRRQS